MSEHMYRAQILLEPRQRLKLEELARREGRSISSVTRQVIDAGLEILGDETEIWRKRTSILTEMRAIRENQSSEYSGDLINEARQEREDEMDQLWHGE